MAIYRVTLQTSLLVEANDERDAERIGFKHLDDEVNNGNSDVYSIEEITHVDQLRRDERGSLPWQDHLRNRGPERPVEEILGAP